ncbi:MAG: hypothetical protein QX196_08800 [Methylococcaceae bacterium]
MKNLACLVILSVFQTLVVLAQSPEQNLMKYWKHRGQLDDFILRGEGIDATTVHGSYLPASNRRPVGHPGDYNIGEDYFHYEDYWEGLAWTPTTPTCGGLNFGGDCTMYLGWYISVLATEYGLHKRNGSAANAEATLEELWSALEAYERLDKMAETTQKTDLIYT